MDVASAIKMRRSIRKYKNKPVEEEKLKAVLEAARLAPSSYNLQERKVIAVRDKKLIGELVDACGGMKFVGEAPAVIVACGLSSDKVMPCGQPQGTVDAAIIMSFMLLEATEQGLGTCWLGNFNKDKVKSMLGIPENVAVVAVSPLGYPDEQPQARSRKELIEVASCDKF